MDESKKFWKSKTFWASLITVFVPYFPPAAALVAANPEVVMTIVGAAFGALRIVTKEPLTIKK